MTCRWQALHCRPGRESQSAHFRLQPVSTLLRGIISTFVDRHSKCGRCSYHGDSSQSAYPQRCISVRVAAAFHQICLTNSMYSIDPMCRTQTLAVGSTSPHSTLQKHGWLKSNHWAPFAQRQFIAGRHRGLIAHHKTLYPSDDHLNMHKKGNNLLIFRPDTDHHQCLL